MISETPVPLDVGGGTTSAMYAVGRTVLIKVPRVPDNVLEAEAKTHVRAYKLAPHVVVPPIGVVKIGGRLGLAMTRVWGFPGPTPTHSLCTVHDVIQHYTYVPDIDVTFRSLIFQTLNGLVDLTITNDKATEGTFRHNDLHVRNVGVDVLDTPIVKPVTVTVTKRVGGVECSVVTHTVYNYNVPMAARVQILDFGHAVFVRRGTPDVRFRKKSRGYTVGGMSASVPSRHYDMFLFLSSVFVTTRDVRPAPPVFQDFRAMYLDLFGNLLTSKFVTDGGRLTDAAQAALLQNLNLTYDDDTAPVFMLYPERVLQHGFFDCFRVDGTPAAPRSSSPAAPRSSSPAFGPAARTMPVSDYLAAAGATPCLWPANPTTPLSDL